MPPVFLAALPQIILEALRLLNLLLEGIPVQQRQAEAVKWFWLTWPAAQRFLKWAGAPADAIAQIESIMKGSPQ